MSDKRVIEAAEGKKEKKGDDGINAVLVLMKDMRDFQEKVDTCLEAQSVPENRAKIQQFDTMLDKMYESLLDIAGGGIRSVRKRKIEKVQGAPVMLNAPQIPKI